MSAHGLYDCFVFLFVCLFVCFCIIVEELKKELASIQQQIAEARNEELKIVLMQKEMFLMQKEMFLTNQLQEALKIGKFFVIILSTLSLIFNSLP